MKTIETASLSDIIALALQGVDGRFWYGVAQREVRTGAERLAVTPERFASILAVTSPRVQVKRNILMAVMYCKFGTLPGSMATTRSAVAHYEATGEIRGPKTGPFARAILGDEEAIVLDVWMARAFGIDQKRFGAKYVRAHCEAIIRQVANHLGWTPAQVQAAVWTAAVRRAGRKPTPFLIGEVIG